LKGEEDEEIEWDLEGFVGLVGLVAEPKEVDCQIQAHHSQRGKEDPSHGA
jgi:hypothetical protein